jgi:hypothetical protein
MCIASIMCGIHSAVDDCYMDDRLCILFHKLPKNVNKIGQKIFLVENFILILWREIYFPVLTNPSIIKVPFSSGIFLLNKRLVKHTYI